MKVHIISYEPLNSWILGKMSTKLQEHLENINIRCTVSKKPDPDADINYHICYISWNSQYTKNDTLMITHIDTETEFERVSSQLPSAEMGICLSRETMLNLVKRGLDSSKLCYINPAIDHALPPRKIHLGIASRLYPDARKREEMLLEIARRISPDDFAFHIIGSRWDTIIKKLRKKFDVEYIEVFNHDDYARFMQTIDYYLYLGLDEGSIGFLDALSSGVPTIVTPQGFHLDIPGGITHSFTDISELHRILTTLARAKRARQRSVAALTWENYARTHAAVWEFVLARKKGTAVSDDCRRTLEQTGLVRRRFGPRALNAIKHPKAALAKVLREISRFIS